MARVAKGPRFLDLVVAASLSLAAAGIRAEIEIDGIEDRSVHADRAEFRIVPVEGTVDAATLNGTPLDASAEVEVTAPDYYELAVTRTGAGGGEESRTVRFIVRDRARGNSEWGLRPWSAHPAIPSAAAELAGSSVRVVSPRAYPGGLDVPIAIFVEDAAGRRVGVNVEARSPDSPELSLPLLRGVGSGFIPAPPEPLERLDLDLHVGPLAASLAVELDAMERWVEVGGEIDSAADWGEDARIDVVSDLRIGGGGSLRIGAGSVVRLAAGVDIEVAGTVEIAGGAGRPVVFAPRSRAAPWGGFVVRGEGASVDVEHAIFHGSGADADWFDDGDDRGSSHRKEQSLLFLADGATARWSDAILHDGAGQAGHGERATLEMTRCLVQRFTTGGQFNRGSVTLRDCALVEFPAADAPFADDDNDALYLTGGAHALERCLIGWALDDGIDAGSGSAGSVDVVDCWVESCNHEGLAWSQGRAASVRGTVVIDCGQGVECGFGSPEVDVADSLLTSNLVGARFGDNYDWDYEGFLRVTGSLLVHNGRDVWGMNWDDWTQRLDQMDIRENRLGAADPLHPANDVFDAADVAALEPFLPAAPGPVGLGLAIRGDRVEAEALRRGVPVRLSSFSTDPVEVGYAVTIAGAEVASGSLRFAPAQSLQSLRVDALPPGAAGIARLSLRDPIGAELSGRREALIVLGPAPAPRFIRGDANRDGAIDISDPLRTLLALFTGAALDCADAADTDDDGSLRLTDAIALLDFLFRAGPLPGAPYPIAGDDPSPDSLDCSQ